MTGAATKTGKYKAFDMVELSGLLAVAAHERISYSLASEAKRFAASTMRGEAEKALAQMLQNPEHRETLLKVSPDIDKTLAAGIDLSIAPSTEEIDEPNAFGEMLAASWVQFLRQGLGARESLPLDSELLPSKDAVSADLWSLLRRSWNPFVIGEDHIPQIMERFAANLMEGNNQVLLPAGLMLVRRGIGGYPFALVRSRA